MWIRRAFYSWLFPAALVLPLWLFIGWGVFQAGGWAFLWVLFVALPSVLVGEVALGLLVRARPTVREERAVSWRDVVGFAVWHALTIALGFFPKDAFGWLLTGTIVAFLGLFWSTLRQLWKDVAERGRAGFDGDAMHATTYGDQSDAVRERARQHAEVIVISETGRPGDGRSEH
ncbi:MFS transporter permease [Microbacterium sp. Au-Mic1]|uniref:MFS transporter permease n=1 Tax=Microbacterium sp. Au-Mic1 TaxID=2906457 RepID=UPI001E2E4495|nr:MFS transporter permease [Microbacterium sp. Au-Mic1]MCE4024650.1 MFS transporter permease [Microbacterium sp. Au-Mic1]